MCGLAKRLILGAIAPSPDIHYEAAQRHMEAAASHDRMAKYWEQHGDPERTTLQRELAEHERRGAELERRWANLVERESAP